MNTKERSLLKSLSKLNHSNLQWFRQFMANIMKINGYSKEFYRELDNIARRKQLELKLLKFRKDCKKAGIKSIEVSY